MSGGPKRQLALAILTVVACLVVLPLVATAQDDTADAGPVPGQIGVPEPGKRLYDMANVFDDGQEWQIEQDAARLAGHGIPVVIVVQPSDLSAEEATSFAGEVRHEWAVESGPGAADGLVVYIGINGEGTATPVMSWGERAFPHFGVSETTASRIESDWLDALVADGHAYEAVDYTLRRLIYHSIYVPGPQEPLTPDQSRVGTLVAVLGPIAAAGAVMLALLLRRRPSLAPPPFGSMLVTVGMCAATAVVAALAVWSRSELGVASALVLLGTGVGAWIRQEEQPGDTLHLSRERAAS